MQYLVVPFTAKITQKDTSTTVAAQIQSMIDHYVEQGWEYIRLESVETAVAPNPGCFGIGAQPGFITTYQMLVFKKI